MPRTVLIVDDSPDSASLLEFALAPLAGLSHCPIISSQSVPGVVCSSSGRG